MNIPIILTLLRIASIPFFVLFFYYPPGTGRLIALGIFIAAALTDWLDGFLARSLSQATPFGAFLDPVADKLLVVTALVLIVSQPHGHYLALPAVIIVCREVSISALREWMAQVGSLVKVNVMWIAQIKTTFQMIALAVLVLYQPGYAPFIFYIGAILLYCAAALTLWSMGIYLYGAWPDLTLAKKQR
jgi:CDP-diacylglycerol--glycerol-3-phosphate 3-phosphatidyltransferase